MASAESATLESINEAINFALRKTKNYHLNLKIEQKEAIKSIISGKDTIAVLPTGFGKSLIYQLLPSTFDYLQSRRKRVSAVWPESIVLVISPLNALMDEQIQKLTNDMDVKCLVLRHDQDIKGL